MMKGWIHRSHLIFALILIVLIILTSKEPDRPTQPWTSHPDFYRVVVPAPRGPTQRVIDPPWERYQGSDMYNEFMEYLDDKGILLDEPDAIDIWEKNFE